MSAYSKPADELESIIDPNQTIKRRSCVCVCSDTSAV